MKKSRHILAISALLALMPLAAGCRSDADSVPDPAPAPATIDLALDVAVADRGYAADKPRELTRAADPDDYELPAYESEDLHHLRVIIAEEKTGIVVHNRGIRFSGGVPVSDDMRFSVSPSTTYGVYLIGNGESLGIDFNTLYAPGSKFDAGLLSSFELSCEPGTPLYDNTGSAKTDIPMTESFRVSTPEALPSGTTEYRVSMFVTRVASKFSFGITTAGGFAGVGARLTSVKISGIGNREYLFPRNAVYNPAKELPSTNKYEGREITSFDVPATVTRGDYVYTFPAPVDLPVEGYVWAPELYLPETALPASGKFMCTVSFDNGQSWLVPVELPNLPYGLPRNTHVVVNITLSDKNMAVLDVNVLPWDTEINEFDYTDQIGIASDGALAFTQGTYLGLDKATARLVLDYPNAATGSFGIATPAGARWDAYLVATSGEQDAILFRLPDGTTTGHIHGLVGNRKAEFSITAVNAPGTTANTAVMQVTVTMADGRTLPANVLQGGGYGAGYDMITIIQNPQ